VEELPSRRAQHALRICGPILDDGTSGNDGGIGPADGGGVTSDGSSHVKNGPVGSGGSFWPSGSDDGRGEWHRQQLLEVLAWRALTEGLLALQTVLVELLALPAVPELFAAGVGNGGIGADGEVAMDVLADYSWERQPSNREKYQNLNH